MSEKFLLNPTTLGTILFGLLEIAKEDGAVVSLYWDDNATVDGGEPGLWVCTVEQIGPEGSREVVARETGVGIDDAVFWARVLYEKQVRRSLDAIRVYSQRHYRSETREGTGDTEA